MAAELQHSCVRIRSPEAKKKPSDVSSGAEALIEDVHRGHHRIEADGATYHSTPTCRDRDRFTIAAHQISIAATSVGNP